MTIKALYPTVRPTLNLDFAKTKRLDPRVTFTRVMTGASVATFVGADGLIKTAGNNVPRFDHNPQTGESLGLLVEEARTNLRTNSENVSSWSQVAGQLNTTDANVIAAPDGAITADNRYGNSGQITAANLLETNATVASGQSIVMSVYAKYVPSSKYQWISLNLSINGSNVPRVVFNLQTGAIAYVNTISGYSQILPNGWFRFIAIHTNSTGSSQTWGGNTCRVFAVDASDADIAPGSGTGSAVDGVYLWGGQVELGSFPTSYIPTTGSTVTRAADVASITGANFTSFYRADEGTLHSTGRFYQLDSFAFQVETDSHGLSLGKDTGSFFRLRALQFSSLSDSSRAFTTNQVKLAVAGVANNAASAFNGVISATSTANPSVTAQPAALSIGARIDGSGRYSGTIARLTYYPVRLPDAQLQALTR